MAVHSNNIFYFDNMGRTRNFSISDTALSIIAVVLTLGDILGRGSVFILKKIIALVFQLICILLLTAAIVLAYLIVMAVSTAMVPWFNTHIQ